MEQQYQHSSVPVVFATVQGIADLPNKPSRTFTGIYIEILEINKPPKVEY